MPITADFSRRLMTRKTTITLSSTVLAAVALLFASVALAATQAHGLHVRFLGPPIHPWWGWHHGWSWGHGGGWHHGWGWGHGGGGGDGTCIQREMCMLGAHWDPRECRCVST